jgi:hypothetical protein
MPAAGASGTSRPALEANSTSGGLIEQHLSMRFSVTEGVGDLLLFRLITVIGI